MCLRCKTSSNDHHYIGDHLKLQYLNVARQRNGHDCGIYAIAFATALLHGQDPTTLHFIKPHAHLLKCFKTNEMTPFPSKVRYNTKPIHAEYVEALYCICRGIDDGTAMVEWELCQTWYHCRCVGVDMKATEDTEWHCEKCSQWYLHSSLYIHMASVMMTFDFERIFMWIIHFAYYQFSNPLCTHTWPKVSKI